MTWLKSFLNSLNLTSVYNVERMLTAHMPRIAVRQVTGTGDAGKYFAELYYRGKIACCDFEITHADLEEPIMVHEILRNVADDLMADMTSCLNQLEVTAVKE